MLIDRRTFVAGTALVAVAPALQLLPAEAASPVTEPTAPVLMIDGWSTQDDSGNDAQVWIRVGHGWRTAWR
jgi:hypothetical protein